MFYIDQPPTPTFPIGLVKTESSFTVRSVETGLGRWTLVVAVGSVNAYPFWLFQTWPVTLRIQEQVFSGCTVPPDSKETEIGSSDQEASLSTSKNTGVGFDSFSKMFMQGRASLQLFAVVWICLRSLGVICYKRWFFSEGHKNYYI